MTEHTFEAVNVGDAASPRVTIVKQANGGWSIIGGSGLPIGSSFTFDPDSSDDKQVVEVKR